MQYTGTTQKHHDKAHNNQRRDLAPDKHELIDKHLTVFTEFVKSIDFTKVQQRRHSAVQYKLEHVVLLELYWSML